jgi:hypothetical protein
MGCLDAIESSEGRYIMGKVNSFCSCIYTISFGFLMPLSPLKGETQWVKNLLSASVP